MYCTVKDVPAPTLTLAHARAGEVFIVKHPSLVHAVCALACPFRGEQATEALRSVDEALERYFGVASMDAKINVVVVACSVREGHAAYVQTGFELDLDRATPITLLRQLQPVEFEVVRPQPRREHVETAPADRATDGARADASGATAQHADPAWPPEVRVIQISSRVLAGIIHATSETQRPKDGVAPTQGGAS